MLLKTPFPGALFLTALLFEAGCSLSFTTRPVQKSGNPQVGAPVFTLGTCPKRSGFTIPADLTTPHPVHQGTWKADALAPETEVVDWNAGHSVVSDISDDGRQIIAWIGSSTSNGGASQAGALVRYKNAAGNWASTYLIPGVPTAGSTAALEQVSLTPTGAVLLWSEAGVVISNERTITLMSATFTEATGLWTVQTVHKFPDIETKESLQFFALPDGTRTLLWLELSSDGTTKRFAQSRLESAAGWKNACLIDGSGVSSSIEGIVDYRFRSTAQMDPSSGAILILFRAPSNLIEGIYVDPSGASSAVSYLPEPETFSMAPISIGFAGPGKANVVWGSQLTATTGTALRSAVYSVGSNAWSSAQLIMQNPVSQYSYVSSAAAAFSANGNAVVVWLQDDGTNGTEAWRMHGSYFDGSWSTPQLVEPTGGDEYYRYPNVVIDEAGNATAAFTVAGSQYHLCCTTVRWEVGSGWKTPVNLLAGSGDRMYFLGLNLGAAGAVHLALNSHDASALSEELYVADFDPTAHSWNVPTPLINYAGVSSEAPRTHFAPSGIGSMAGAPIGQAGNLYLFNYR